MNAASRTLIILELTTMILDQAFLQEDGPPASMLALMRTSRDINETVLHYIQSRYSVSRVLRRFIDDVAGFRTLQYNTRFLISGSTALQLFTRRTFPSSDLDVYAFDNADIGAIGNWFIAQGYDFDWRMGQAHAWAAASIQRGTGTVSPYMREVVEIFTFTKFVNGNGKKIQLIVAETSPIACILGFHSCTLSGPRRQRSTFAYFFPLSRCHECHIIQPSILSISRTYHYPQKIYHHVL